MARLFCYIWKKKRNEMKCLSEIIGIINTECGCVTGALTPEELEPLKRSTSGLYLEDLEGGLNMRGVSVLDSCKNFAQMSLFARDGAVKRLEADVLTALSLKYKTGKGAFIGNIGRPSYATTLQTNKRFQYLRMRPAQQSDAVMKVTGLRVIVDRAATLNVRILSVPEGGNQGTEVFAGSAEAQANTYATIPVPTETPLMLPLSVQGQPMEYYVIWDKVAAGGANPKDLKLDCNCGFKNNPIAEYMKLEGGEVEDDQMLSTGSKDVYSHGIVLDVDVRCVPGNLICREYDRENAIAVTMAYATMYKAGELLIESVMSSNEINRYTMMNREYLWGKRNHFRKEYETRIQYLASTIDVSSSDCYICREDRMYMSGILV